MSKIFELYGYRLDHWSAQAEENLKSAWCPFMNVECNGGGNRFQSAITCYNNPKLSAKIPNKNIIQVGICSILTRAGEQPWIVCPHRLLSLKGEAISERQLFVRRQLSKYAEIEASHKHFIWSEVKIKTNSLNSEMESKIFDCKFDYILSGVQPERIADISSFLNLSIDKVKLAAESNGYTLVMRNGEFWVDDFPSDPLIIIEVMTSSTSGGNKRNRTQMAMACEDAILNGKEHKAPGINYRQVWARMVSQLIVKSQVGMAWGGKTIWVLQDVLAEYISRSTGLVLSKHRSDCLNEVNIMTFGYGDKKDTDKNSIIEMENHELFTGPIIQSRDSFKHDGFIDIVKIGEAPPKTLLWKALLNKTPIGVWNS